MPELSVIIVNLNTKNWLKPCLTSLQKQDVFKSLEIIVVENASTDGSTEMVLQAFPACKLVQLSEIVGFGQANNEGVRHSTAPLILFLNPDTIVPEESLKKLLHLLEKHPQCGISGGIIYDGDGKLERSAGSFPSLFSLGFDRLLKYVPPTRPIFGRLSHQNWVGYDRPHRVDWVTGAYMCIRRGVFEKIGGFDENIFMYLEDVELCYQARQVGFECWFFPEAPITHYRKKAPVPRPRKQMLRESLLYFANKHNRSPRYWFTRVIFRILSKASI